VAVQEAEGERICYQGQVPVVWDPKEGCPVGDHDRISGEGEVPQEFCLFKFRLDDNRLIITATLRPDTVMGITNVYVHPDEFYAEAEVKGERWIIGKPMADKLRMQDFDVKIIGEVKGDTLVGKKVESFSGLKIWCFQQLFLTAVMEPGWCIRCLQILQTTLLR